MVVAAAVIALLVAGGLSAASAQPGAREYGESGVDAGVVRVEAGAEWLPVGSAGSGGGGSRCTTSNVKVIVNDDFDQPVNQGWRSFGSDGSLPFAAEPSDLPASLPTAMRSFSPTGRWYEVMCDGVIRVVPEGGPAVTIPGLLQQAFQELDPPEPELSVVPAEFHVTQLPSWLAVEPAYWFERQSTPATAGRVWVIGFADPYEVVWDPGDGTGEMEPCGPGTVWQPGLDAEANTCPYTYRRSSAGAPGDSFTLTATVSFAVRAESNAPGADGTFPDLTRTTSVDIEVGEIQAVND